VNLCFIVITNSDASLVAPTLSPEPLKRRRGAGHAVVGEEEPKAEDWLGKDIENSVANNFGVNADNSATLGKTPDAVET